MTNTDDIREFIEGREEKATAGPNPQAWDQMEQAATQAEKQAQQNPGWTQGENIPTENVPEDERLQRPVGTETDSY